MFSKAEEQRQKLINTVIWELLSVFVVSFKCLQEKPPATKRRFPH